MFLYLGDGKYKRLSELIGIFDMDSATVCAETRRFLSGCEREGSVESDGELPKSFLLCEEAENKGKTKGKRKKRVKGQKKAFSVFLSRLSSGVLAARTARVRDGHTEEDIV